MLPSTPPRSSRLEPTQRTPTSRTLGSETPHSIIKKPIKGLFQDGRWYCDCSPREVCVLLQAKNPQNPRNSGKWFWRCGTSKNCDFMLWQEAAKRREGMSVERDEDVIPPPTDATPFKQRDITAYFSITPRGEAAYPDSHDCTATMVTDDKSSGSVGDGDGDVTAPATPCPVSHKRKRNALQDEDFCGEMTPDEERQLAALADQHLLGSTPAGVEITPAITRTADIADGLPTPVARTLWPDTNPRSGKRQKNVSFEERPNDSATDLGSPSTVSATFARAIDNAQTPTRSSHPASTPVSSSATHIAPSIATTATISPSTASGTNRIDPTDEIMLLLESHQTHIDPDVLASVRSILRTSALRITGLIQSRDTIRSILRERDVQIGKQQEKIAYLENRNKVAENKTSTTKADLMNIYQRI